MRLPLFLYANIITHDFERIMNDRETKWDEIMNIL